MHRRAFLCGVSALAATRSLAAPPPIPAVTEFERASGGGHVGLYARNLRTGATVSWRANERFVMCSTFKASLAGCVLERVDQNREQLDRQVRFGSADIGDWWAPVAREHLAEGSLSIEALCRAAVEQSDNTCANLLLAEIGGPPALTAFWRAIGDHVTRLDDTEPLLNRTPPGREENTTTPASMANILRRLVAGNILAGHSRMLLTEWLVGCETGLNRLRAGLPSNWRVGDKTGNNGADAAGDIAVAWPRADTPIVIAAYTRGGTPTSAQFETVFAAIGREVASVLG